MGNIRYKGQNYTRSALPVLIEKEITANGTYLASDDNADGYKKVVVDVDASDSIAKFQYDTTFNVFDNLTELTIPDGVTIVGSSTRSSPLFPNLKKLTLSQSVSSVRDYMSYGTQLDYVIQRGGNPHWDCYEKNVKAFVVEAGSAYNQYASLYNSSGIFFLPENLKQTFIDSVDGAKAHIGFANIERLNTVESYEWDFTGNNPLVDSTGTKTLENNGVSFSSEGAIFTLTSGSTTTPYLLLPTDIDPVYNLPFDYEIELDIVSISGGIRCITQTFDKTSASDTASMLAFYQNKWTVWANGKAHNTNLTNIGDLNNSKIKIEWQYVRDVFITSGTYYSPMKSIKVYKDGTLLVTDSSTDNMKMPDANSFNSRTQIGSHRNGCSMIIRGMRLKLSWKV